LEKLQKLTIKKRKDLLSAYLLASRLCTFLSETIPSHPDYFSTQFSTLASTLSFGNSKEDKLKAARKRSQEQLETVLDYLGKITSIIDYEELQTDGLIPRSMLATTNNKKGQEEDYLQKTNASCVEQEQALLTKKEEGSSNNCKLYSNSLLDQDEEPNVCNESVTLGHPLETTPPQSSASPPLFSKILKRFERSELLVAKEEAQSVCDCNSPSSNLNSIDYFGDEKNTAWDIGRDHSANIHIIGQHPISLPWTLDCNKSAASLSGTNHPRQERIALKPFRLQNFVNRQRHNWDPTSITLQVQENEDAENCASY
jgi:hypothetical protein